MVELFYVYSCFFTFFFWCTVCCHRSSNIKDVEWLDTGRSTIITLHTPCTHITSHNNQICCTNTIATPYSATIWYVWGYTKSGRFGSASCMGNEILFLCSLFTILLLLLIGFVRCLLVEMCVSVCVCVSFSVWSMMSLHEFAECPKGSKYLCIEVVEFWPAYHIFVQNVREWDGTVG